MIISAIPVPVQARAGSAVSSAKGNTATACRAGAGTVAGGAGRGRKGRPLARRKALHPATAASSTSGSASQRRGIGKSRVDTRCRSRSAMSCRALWYRRAGLRSRQRRITRCTWGGTRTPVSPMSRTRPLIRWASISAWESPLKGSWRVSIS